MTSIQQGFLFGYVWNYSALQKTAEGLTRKQIVRHLKKLNHPGVGVAGGAAMVLRGLREDTSDIDADTSPEVFNELHALHGSPETEVTDMGTRMYTVPGTPIDLHESFASGESMEGVVGSVSTPEELLPFYEKLNRPKDQQWIKALRQHLKRNETSTKMKTVELSGEVQGIGLRRIAHGKLDELGVPGQAVNDARTSNVYLTAPSYAIDEILAAIQERQVEKGKELGRELPELEIKELKKALPLKDVRITPAMVKKFVSGHGLTNLAQGKSPTASSPEQWIGDRFRLKEEDGTLTGVLSPLALKQLKVKEPMYREQIDNPELYGGVMRWSNGHKEAPTA